MKYRIWGIAAAAIGMLVACSKAPDTSNVGQAGEAGQSSLSGQSAPLTVVTKLLAEVADIGLMIWDTKSTGTLSNVIELLVRGKKSVVFVNKAKVFKNIAAVEQLEELLSFMSEHSKKKADDKIKLFDRIDSMKHAQAPLFV